MISTTTKIKLLPEDLTNKIAAGEVVERPASVVKELVENSIDAGATDITIIVKDGGKALIQVVDNGSGMEQGDLLLAFQRHATSKIYTYQDLLQINTLGFRGEALASIASVARIDAKSKTEESDTGYGIQAAGGVLSDIQATACATGTSIAVKQLFYNTPARRKFLKKTATEYRQIVSVLNRFFIAHPEISFTFVNSDEVVFELKRESQNQRLRSVFGARVANNMLQIENEGPVGITGFVGKPDVLRRSRGDQFMFLNRRYFTSKNLHYAVINAFGEILPRGLYPVYAIFLTIDSAEVDVNVHPTKMEIKFANENLIFSSIRGAVKRALNSEKVIPVLSHVSGGEAFSLPDFPLNQTAAFEPARQNAFEFTSPENRESQPAAVSQFPLSEQSEQDAVQNISGTKVRFERTNVWQIHNKYILSQIKSGMIIIDQHVAHERILYEDALKYFELRKPSSQQLLFPQVIELSMEDFTVLLEMIPFLERIGFVIKSFGKKTVAVEGVPSGVKISNDEKILLDILDEYKRGVREKVEIRENVARSFACHSAIKAGDQLSLEEMNMLIDKLFSTKEPYYCPHGRPIVIHVPLEELDRRFKR